MQETLTIISNVMEKKHDSQHGQIRKKVDSVESTKSQTPIHQLKQAKSKAKSSVEDRQHEIQDDTEPQMVNSVSLEADKSDICIQVENKLCNQENETKVASVAKGRPKHMNSKTMKPEDLPTKMTKVPPQINQQQINEKVIPKLDTNPDQKMIKELHQRVPHQHLLHDDTMTPQQEVVITPRSQAVPQPLDSFTPQVNSVMQPTMSSFPTILVPVPSFQYGHVLLQLSPVVFSVTPYNQSHPPHEAYMTSMPEQD